MKCSSLQEQRKLYEQHRDATSRLATLVNATRQFWAPFIGVPDSQLRLFDGNIVTKVFDRIFHETLLAENYFYAAYIRGSYSKDNCPRYLEEEHFGRLKQFVREGRVEVRTGTLKDVVSTYPDGTFSCYVLLDHQDWLSTEAVLDEWEAFFAKADRKSGRARALWRSFSKEQTIAPVSYPLTFDEKSVINVEAAYPDRVAMYNSCHLAYFPSGEPEYAFVKRDAFAPKATCCDDARVMFSNMLAPIAKTDEQQERLESFYARQAGSYDVFRHRMLHGRVPMLLNMPVKRGATWVDIGAGRAQTWSTLAPR